MSGPALRRAALLVLLASLALASSPVGVAEAITREAILSRGERWVAVGTPYSMSRYATDAGVLVPTSATSPSSLGWRTDCSGFVSMCLGLLRSDGKPLSLDTATLPTRLVSITKSQLRPGDVILRPKTAIVNGEQVPYGHAVIFVRWVDGAKTRYVGYHESSGSGKTVAAAITYPFGTAPGFSPYRYLKVEDVRLRKSRTWFGGVVLQPLAMGAYDIAAATGAPAVSLPGSLSPAP